jgi:hypothetical protein
MHFGSIGFVGLVLTDVAEIRRSFVELLGFSSLLTSQSPTYTFMLILGSSEAITTMIH